VSGDYEMANDADTGRSLFAWNVGAWFGTQLGCTLWLLILGIVFFSKDKLATWACIAAFVILNAWGLYLWQSRNRISAYSGLQRFLLVASLIIAPVVLLVNNRDVNALPTSGALVSTYLPYWVILFAPALMLFFFLLERNTRQIRK
jgi:hypothetical protein